MYKKRSEALLKFIEKSPTCYQVVSNLKEILKDYTPLREEQEWKLENGGRYYVTRNDSSIIAFRIPKNPFTGFNIGAAHSDSPLFKIKHNGELVVEKHYVQLNVEKYGGMLCAPWFDRPLSVAGRIVVKNGNSVETKLVDVKKDIAMIVNLSIHMNRKANDGYLYNPQVDMLPLFGGIEAKDTFMSVIAESAGVREEDILGTDLFLYNRMNGVIWGKNEEFISSRSLDDLQCAWSLVTALSEADENSDKVALCAVFDNEEVGSGTKQGADSTFLTDTLERINFALGRTPEQLKTAIAGSFMVSADNAHAVHPNHTDKADPTNRPYMNEGIVIKYNANQKYCTDSVSEAIFRSICERANVPVQTYANRSDIPGGSTLGNISATQVSVNTVDIGLAQLAMHSPYETAGVKDTEHLISAAKCFFAASIDAKGSGTYIIS